MSLLLRFPIEIDDTPNESRNTDFDNLSFALEEIDLCLAEGNHLPVLLHFAY